MALSMGASFSHTNKCDISAHVRKNDDHFEILVKEIMWLKKQFTQELQANFPENLFKTQQWCQPHVCMIQASNKYLLNN